MASPPKSERVFFDSSAFIKRYVAESGSQQVISICESASEICLSVVAVPEIISAFCRLRREGKINKQQYLELKRSFMSDVADIALADISADVLSDAVLRLEHSPLRGMDAIHIATAHVLKVDLFVSADSQQVAAARLSRLKVAVL